jgi:RNA polymerase sigma factor (sigma-70 family)
MEYWKENVNYRQEKGPEGTRYLITVDGMDVEVEESLYRIYTKMERRERYLVEVESDMCVSLEGLAADEDTIPYLPDNPESILIAVETEREQASLLCLLPEALEQLTESEREFIRALYFEGISLREYCRSKGIPVMTQHYRLQQVLKKLKNILS